VKKHFITTTVSLLSIAMLGGCANSLTNRNAASFDESAHVIVNRQAQARAAIMENETRRLAAQEVARPYVAGQSIPMSRDAHMPPQLRASVPVTALYSNSPVDLPTALRQVSTATGLSFTATPDALMSAGAFAARTGGVAASLALPSVMLRANNTPLWKLLDDIAGQALVSWRPTPNGAEFYRVETRTYELMSIPQIASTAASLGRGGSDNNQFSSQSKTSFTMKDTNQLDGIKTIVDSMISTGGKFSISQENQTLVVTDTPASHARVAEFVKKQNKAMSRRVRMIVEAIEVVSKEGSDFGIDWSLVQNTTSQALTANSPSTLASAQGGVLNLGQMIGPLSGSGVVIKALNEIGTVVNRRVFPFTTTSGRPITQALRTTFNYVDQVQATNLPSNGTTTPQTPTVTQKDETVGTFLTMVPTAKPDGSVFLSVSFDVTTADPLRPYTVGTGAAAVTVQQKTINGSGVVQEVSVRSGRTEVIGGIEVMSATSTSRRLGEDVPILAGGSNSSASAKSVTVLLVTAVVEEGV
jgi:type IVB pilus formation R64 PilN family outer membrane protein